jgi:hypothetical protein
MMVVDCITTDLLCMRLCSELSQAESNRRHCKAEVGLSIWSSEDSLSESFCHSLSLGMDVELVVDVFEVEGDLT